LKIVCPTYWYPQHATDTAATYVHDINRHLVGRGHRVRVVSPSGAGEPARDEFDGVEIIRFPLRLPEDLTYGKVAQSAVNPWRRVKRLTTMLRYIVAQCRATAREIRRVRPRVIHAHWAIPTGPAAIAAGRRYGLPVVITMHGGDVYVNPEQGYDFPTRWYVRPVLRWTLRRASALSAITEDCRRHALRAGAPDERVRVIWNGADLKRFRPSVPQQSLIADPRFGPHMVFACRQLFPRKGIRFLIEAAAKLKPRYPDLKLVLAGDGFERPALERQARALGIAADTIFLGWRPNAELPQYYRAAAVSVVPSLEEGFGIPAAEAMGCEVPVVASDAGGLPEVVEDGVTGLVVPKGDADALAAGIDRLLADEQLRVRMGRAGRERALRLFDWERTAERFEELYQEVIGRSGNPG